MWTESTLAGTSRGGRKEHGRTNCWGDCSTSDGTSQGGRKERGQNPHRPELVKAGGRSVSGRIVKEGGDVFKVILIVFRVEE